MQRDPFALTLYDYQNELNWVRQLDWPEQDLRQVPVHEQATSAGPYLNLTNWGGTALGVSAEDGGGSSAAVHNIHNIYVYRNELPERLWNILSTISQRGGPSAFETGVFGERGEAKEFPPR